MANRRQRIDYNFSGGARYNNPKLCLPNQLQEAVNTMIIEGGVIRQRYAFSNNLKSDTKGTAAVDGAFPVDNYRTWSAWSDGTVRILPGTTSYPETVGGPGQYLSVDGGTLRSNGRDPMRFIGATQGDVLGGPQARVIHYHNDRIFAAVGKVLYETFPGETPTHEHDAWADGASWTLPDNIYGLGSIGRNLFIFTRYEIHIQIGYTKSERQTYSFNKDFGCMSPDTIKQVNAAGYGQCLMFLSTMKKICLLTMNGVIEISQAFDNILDTISISNTLDPMCDSLHTGTGFIFVHRAKAVYHRNGFYILGFADSQDVSYSAFDKAVCVSLNVQYDSEHGRLYPMTLWKNTGKNNAINCSFVAMNDSGLFGRPFPTIMARVNTTTPEQYDVLEMHGEEYKDPISNITVAFHADSLSNINEVIGGTANWNYIPIKIKTRDEDAGTKQKLKQWCEVFIRAIQKFPKVPGFASFPLRITQEVEYDLNYDSPPEIEQENIAAPNRPREYEVELSHLLVSDGIQMNITIENFSSLDRPMIQINGISIEFFWSNNL